MTTIPANTSTTATIQPGDEVRSQIDTVGDRDWFRTMLPGGFNYDIRMRGDGTLDALPEPEIFVFDENGEQIFNADVGSFTGSDQSISSVFTVPRDGTYFIAAAGDDDREQGNYILELLEDEASSATNTPVSIAPGQTLTGLINGEGDRDWYRTELPGGFNYDIRMRGDGTLDALPEPEIFVFDENGEQIFNADVGSFTGSDQSISSVFTVPRDGTYFIAAAGDDDREQGGYELTLGMDEAASATVTPLVLRPGKAITGEIGGFGDGDWYRTALVGGSEYLIELRGTGSNSPLTEVRINIYDEDGVFIGGRSDFSPIGAETTLFTPPESGLYFIEARGDDNRHAGDYELRLEGDASLGVGATGEEVQSIALLYEAGLGRPAAYLGLNFWIDRFEAGNSLSRIAQSFLDSSEFATNVGDPQTLSDGDLINGLFNNVIGRPPAQAGFDFWTGRLADGASRADTLLAFATVPENAAQSPEVLTLRPIGDGDGSARDPSDVLVEDIFPEWEFAG